MRKYLRLSLVVLICSTYFALAPFGYVAFTVWHLFPSKNPNARARVLQGIMRRAFRLMHDTLRVSGFLSFNPRRVEGSLPEGPAVLVANHPTLVDVTSIMAAFPNVTTVVKPNLYRRFWFQGLLRDARLFEGATSADGLARMVDDAVERLQEGFRVLIFPEGTRSPEGKLRPFGRAAFEIACRLNVPVVPIVIRCQPVWLSKEYPISRMRDETVHFTLTALEPILPSEHGRTSRQLRDVVEALIHNQLYLTPVQESGTANEQRCS